MNKWLKGLLSAIIGGAADSITVMVVEPSSFNLQEGLSKLLSVAAVSAIVSAAMYLKQSPLPVHDEPPSILGNSGKAVMIAIALWGLAMWGMFAMINGCATTGKTDPQVQTFAIESAAMVVGYEAQDQLQWTDEMEAYYQAIQSGIVTLDGAQAAEAYLRTMTHPVIANRLVELARIMGFGLDDAGTIESVAHVNIPMLQAAARGFKQGLMLDRKQASVGDMWEVNYPVGPYHGGRLVTYLPYGIEVQ